MEAYIVDVVRTPRGAAKKTGSLASVKPIEMAKLLFERLVERNELDPNYIEDVIVGCTNQLKDQGANIGKIAPLFAGMPESISGVTLNRFCSSGLEAIGYGSLKIHGGTEDLIIAGGTQSLSRLPMGIDEGAWYGDPEVSEAVNYVNNVIAADLMASLERFDRKPLDEFGAKSHMRAMNARDKGYFSPSLIPVYDKENNLLLDKDELIREDNTMEKLSTFDPFYKEFDDMRIRNIMNRRYPSLKELSHVHHKGNSPSLADGASFALLASKKKMAQLGLKPRAKIVAFANQAADPMLLIGAQKATEKILAKTGFSVNDIDLFECNESFAASVVKYQRDLKIDPECLNVNGGVIAMGHSLGGTGGMLLAVLLDELERRDLKRGLISITGGAGTGTAMIIERV